MDKKNLIIIGLIVGLFISAGSSLLIYDQWQHEKDLRREAETELLLVHTELKALKSNSEEDLTIIAEDFVKALFTFNPKQVEKPSERAQEFVTGKAKEKLFQKPEKGSHGEYGAQTDISSQVEVIDSQYNIKSSDSAAVHMEFEQALTLNGSTVKTLNDMEIILKYTEDGWKVEDYQLKQLY